MNKLSLFFETISNAINIYAPYLLFVFTVAALAAILTPYFLGPEYHIWEIRGIK